MVTWGWDPGSDDPDLFANGNAGVERVLPNGQPDPTFGTNGVAAYNGISHPTSVAVDSQDRVLLGGAKDLDDETGDDYAANLVRFDASGDLDPTFDGNGSLGLGHQIPRGIAVRPNGRIVLGIAPEPSFVDPNTGFPPARIVQLLDSGQTDGAGFGNGGQQPMDFAFQGSGGSTIVDLVLRPDGKVTALGTVESGGTNHLVVRLNADGSRDQTLTGGNAGQSGFALIPDEDWWALAVDGSGRTVITGYSSAETDEALLRLLANGAPDQSFGGDGLVATDTTPSSGEHPTDVLVDTAGKIWMGGNSNCPFLARFTSTGALDTSFSQDGSSVDCSSFVGFVNRLAMDSSGRPLMSGDGGSAGDAPGTTVVIRWKRNGSGPPPPPPDGDGDGVPDFSDACPTVAGSASNNGCPVSTPPADTDGDGVPDATDRCPTQRGVASNSGCPQGGTLGAVSATVHRIVIPRSRRKLVRSGVRVLASCQERCKIHAEASVSPKTASALGTANGLLGSGDLVIPAGQRWWVTVRVFPALRRALLVLARRVAIRVSVDATEP